MFERFRIKNVKKALDFPKKIEKPMFFIRRMQKVCQNDLVSEFWLGALVGGSMQGILTVGPKCVWTYYNSVCASEVNLRLLQ